MTNKRDAMDDAIATFKFGMTPAEAVHNGICVKCKQPVHYRMSDYLHTGLCPECHPLSR